MRLALGLRTRLTLFVTVVFALAMSLVAIVTVDRIEDALIADTRASAEAVLADYLDAINGGVASIGVIDDEQGTRFFYRDAQGNELTEAEYFQLIAPALAGGLVALELPGVELGYPVLGEPDLVIAGGSMALTDGDPTNLSVEPTTGALVTGQGMVVEFVRGPSFDGVPEPVDLGDDVVGVSQRLSFPDGTGFEVGVSTPLSPVTDSIDVIRSLLGIGVPILVLVVAAITWLAATRALAPVRAVSSRARAITADNLEDRLPVPAASDEVAELVDTMNDMLARLQRSQDRQRQLVADASHELRSPVAASRAQLEVASSSPDLADWEATAATVLGEQERLSDLIDDLLALSRLEGAGVTTTVRLDLEALVRDEAARPRSPTPEVGSRSGMDVEIVGNPQLLNRAVGNLLDNAARHAAGRVKVTIGRTTTAAVIHVDDDGPGVPPDHREKIFERFSRLDEARDRDRGGTGLGLAIAREVAIAHGGDLSCDCSPIGGARFTLAIAAP